MTTKEGTCKYCGQIKLMNIPETFNQEDIDDEATRACDCAEARAYTKREENIAGAESGIRDLFKDLEELNDVKKLMLDAVRPVAESKISKISISKGRYTAGMKPGKDAIKVSLKYTEEETREL